MHDIIEPQLAAQAKKNGIQPLIIGEDVTLVKNKQELKEADTLLVLATRPDRELLEANIDGVINLETAPKEDFMHHRRAGLDQVSAKILKEKGAVIILNLQALKEAEEPHVVLGRMQQNARIAKKLGVRVLLASGANKDFVTPHDQAAFWRAMGIGEKIIADNQQEYEEWLTQARLRASDEYVAEGVTRTNNEDKSI